MAATSRTVAPRTGTPVKGTPKTSPKKPVKAGRSVLSGASTPVTHKVDQLDADMVAMGLRDADGTTEPKIDESPPKMTLEREKILQEARRALAGEGGVKPKLSIVIIGRCETFGHSLCILDTFLGHVDAGKSTLVGRLLYELGRIEAKKRAQTDRASEKSGKSSFTWAWELDSGEEERQRYATTCCSDVCVDEAKRNHYRHCPNRSSSQNERVDRSRRSRS